MKECKPEPKTLRSRLDTYGLANVEEQLVDITLEANQQLVLSMQDPQTQKYTVTLRPQSPYDLKKWIGIPDHAVRNGLQTLDDETRSASQVNGTACPVFVPQLQVVPGDSEMQTNLSSFLFRNTSAITRGELSVIEKYMERSEIGISVVLARDIHVAAGAQLIVDKKIQVLFARYITLAATGQIKFQSPYAKLDCAGMRRQSPFFNKPSTTVTREVTLINSAER